jgi:hypothetical protein
VSCTASWSTHAPTGTATIAGAAVAAAAYIDGRLQITKDLRDLWNVKRAQFEWNRAGNLPTKPVCSIEALTDTNFDSQERGSLTLVSIRATSRTSTFLDTMHLVQNWVLYLVRDARPSLPVRRVLLDQRSPT